jgi:hypothetical protein
MDIFKLILISSFNPSQYIGISTLVAPNNQDLQPTVAETFFGPPYPCLSNILVQSCGDGSLRLSLKHSVSLLVNVRKRLNFVIKSVADGKDVAAMP